MCANKVHHNLPPQLQSLRIDGSNYMTSTANHVFTPWNYYLLRVSVRDYNTAILRDISGGTSY